MKVLLCHSGQCCPAVEINGNEVIIGEDDNIVRLKREEWDVLKELIKRGEI